MDRYYLSTTKHAKKVRIKFPFSFHALIATWFYSGRFPIAPGTMGSLATYPLYAFVTNSVASTLEAQIYFFIMTLLLTMLGTWSIEKFQRQIKIHDHECIVIDEVVGMTLTFALSMTWAAKMAFWVDNHFHIAISPQNLAFFLGFIVFRYFDIRKPFFIGTFDASFHRPFGVILDDLMAALFASGVLYIISLIISAVG